MKQDIAIQAARGIYSDNITVSDLVNRYVQLRTGVAPGTMAGYKTVQNLLEKNPFGRKQIDIVGYALEKYFLHICEKYNSIYKVQLPKITPHVCRHTYCTNMAKSGISAKALQYLMGHSDIEVTLNVYTHLGLADAQHELERVDAEQEIDTKKAKNHFKHRSRKKA